MIGHTLDTVARWRPSGDSDTPYTKPRWPLRSVALITSPCCVEKRDG